MEAVKEKIKFATPDERMEIPKAILTVVDLIGRLEFTTDDGKVYLITRQ